jgi:hypothetical protein
MAVTSRDTSDFKGVTLSESSPQVIVIKRTATMQIAVNQINRKEKVSHFIRIIFLLPNNKKILAVLSLQLTIDKTLLKSK